MAKSCAGCGYYDGTGEAADCPTCARALQVTYLPSPDAPQMLPLGPPPLALRAARPAAEFTRHDPMTHFEAFRSLYGFRAVAALAVLPLLFLSYLAVGLGQRDVTERFGRVRRGMTVEQIDAIFAQPARLNQTAERSQTLADGRGSMTYRNGSAAVVVSFSFGRVTDARLEGVAAPT